MHYIYGALSPGAPKITVVASPTSEHTSHALGARMALDKSRESNLFLITTKFHTVPIDPVHTRCSFHEPGVNGVEQRLLLLAGALSNYFDHELLERTDES